MLILFKLVQEFCVHNLYDVYVLSPTGCAIKKIYLVNAYGRLVLYYINHIQPATSYSFTMFN